MSLSRRRLLTGTTAIAATAIAAPAMLTRPANAAEFTYKLGDVLPMAHPLNGRSVEAAKKILEQTNGKLEIKVYPNSVLGQDTALMSQAISGALQMYVVATDILAARSPSAAVFGTGFAFKNTQQTFAAMDGDLGKYVRGLAEKAGLYCMDKCFDHGFREITSRAKPIKTPDDLKGMKIRLPVAPGMIELFRYLGAAPTAINLGEVYSALQTGVVDGQENPLILIDTAKFYEVQKYCSMTNHLWAGLHVSFNNAAWKRLPPDIQEIVHKNFSEAAMLERADWQVMTKAEITKLTKNGLTFIYPDAKPFQEVLNKSGYYPEMKKKVGDQAWNLLEKYVGTLA